MKIKVYGKGGQGVIWLGKQLGKFFVKQGYKSVTIRSDYDAVTRGGKANTEITASNNPKSSPFIDFADIAVLLVDQVNINASRIIADKSVQNPPENSTVIDFSKKGKRLNESVLNYLIALCATL